MDRLKMSARQAAMLGSNNNILVNDRNDRTGTTDWGSQAVLLFTFSLTKSTRTEDDCERLQNRQRSKTPGLVSRLYREHQND